jgi:hypothetical protein
MASMCFFNKLVGNFLSQILILAALAMLFLTVVWHREVIFISFAG